MQRVVRGEKFDSKKDIEKRRLVAKNCDELRGGWVVRRGEEGRGRGGEEGG